MKKKLSLKSSHGQEVGKKKLVLCNHILRKPKWSHSIFHHVPIMHQQTS